MRTSMHACIPTHSAIYQYTYPCPDLKINVHTKTDSSEGAQHAHLIGKLLATKLGSRTLKLLSIHVGAFSFLVTQLFLGHLDRA